MNLHRSSTALAVAVVGLLTLTYQAAATTTASPAVYLGLIQAVAPNDIKVSNP